MKTITLTLITLVLIAGIIWAHRTHPAGHAATVKRVRDGDTITVETPTRFSVPHKVDVRILGIDTPEFDDDGWGRLASTSIPFYAPATRSRSFSIRRKLARMFTVVFSPTFSTVVWMLASAWFAMDMPVRGGRERLTVRSAPVTIWSWSGRRSRPGLVCGARMGISGNATPDMVR